MGWVANDSCGGRLLTRQPADYYGYATDAIASGHLALKIEPRPELKALSNPYSGTLNQPYRVLDLSYFKGRYYFYWGLAPVVLLFGPVHLVTGEFVAEPVAGAAFGTVALACLGWLVLALRRRYCARSPTVLAILALLAIGSGSFLCLVGTTDIVYGIPIACAAFGQALALCCVAQAIHSTRQPVAWTLGAGIGIAVALGSRPNNVLWAPANFSFPSFTWSAGTGTGDGALLPPRCFRPPRPFRRCSSRITSGSERRPSSGCTTSSRARRSPRRSTARRTSPQTLGSTSGTPRPSCAFSPSPRCLHPGLSACSARCRLSLGSWASSS